MKGKGKAVAVRKAVPLVDEQGYTENETALICEIVFLLDFLGSVVKPSQRRADGSAAVVAHDTGIALARLREVPVAVSEYGLTYSRKYAARVVEVFDRLAREHPKFVKELDPELWSAPCPGCRGTGDLNITIHVPQKVTT